MNAKRIIVKHLMQTLQDEYWNANLKQRLERLKAILPNNRDYFYEESEA